jgi:hypothetical protein
MLLLTLLYALQIRAIIRFHRFAALPGASYQLRAENASANNLFSCHDMIIPDE